MGIGLLLHMHGVAIGTQWVSACCFTCMVLPQEHREHQLVPSHTWCCHRNRVGISLLHHVHGVAIGTQWALASCIMCMVLP